MGGRGTFGTKENKLNRESIINTLTEEQFCNIAINGKVIAKADYRNISNNDLSILKEFINKRGVSGSIINLTSNFSTKHVGRPIIQGKTKVNGRDRTIIQINRTIYKTRGIKYFNNVMKSYGYEKGLKDFEVKKPKKK